MEKHWQLSLECAGAIYGSRPPTDRYRFAVAQQLFGTGAAESEYRTRRQWGFDWWSTGGAFSFWQIERGSVACSLAWLRRRPEVAQRAALWLYGDIRAQDAAAQLTPERVLDLLRACDRAGVLFARLHYLRIPDPIPATIQDQAEYWKQHYNTPLGAGTPAGFIRLATAAARGLEIWS